MQIEITGLMPEEYCREDGGQALIADLDYMKWSGCDDAFFVRLHSYSEKAEHRTMDSLRNKHIKITIEVLD